MELYGIDVSHYQGTIDFAKVKAAGKSFVILKLSQGSSLKDSKFDEYYAGAKAAGLPVGVYIYNKVTSVSKAEAEAKFAVKCLAGKTLDLGVWLDLEDSTMKSLGKTMLSNIIRTEASILNAAGYAVNIYCNKDWYENVLDSKNLSQYKFWIARYPSNDTGVITASLKTSYMDMWQYSSKGTVAGINGRVDMDVIYNSEILSVKAKATNPYTEPKVAVKSGSKGNGAKWVQWELVEAGYTLTIDGAFGPKSVAALKDFQKVHVLTVDGICGKATREALKKW